VHVRLSDIWKNFIVELSHVGVIVQDIFWELFPSDFIEELSPVWEYCLAPCVCLCVSKGQRLSEYLLGIFPVAWFWPWGKFELFCGQWGRAFSHLWFL
jgi:hypothetical protein